MRRALWSLALLLLGALIVATVQDAADQYVPNGRVVLSPGDDIAAHLAAGERVYLSPGIYETDLSIPDGSNILGASKDSVWLKGTVTFGSDCTVRGVKMGDEGGTTRNRAGAARTTFTDCRFRGGGGSFPDQNVLQLGAVGSCSYITFRDCEVERNIISDAVRDANMRDKPYCDIALVARTNGSDVSHVLFEGCHVGVSNGRTDVERNTGSPFAGLVCWTQDSSGTATYSDIVVRDCTFEVCDWDDIDLADYRAGAVCGPVTVEGCYLKGAGSNTLTIEGPRHVTVRNNVIQRSYHSTFAMSPRGATTDQHATITGNTFPLHVDNGITPQSASKGESMVYLDGDHFTFADNTITTNSGGVVLRLRNAVDGSVQGNTLSELRTSFVLSAIELWDAHGNTVAQNTLRTAAATDAVIRFTGHCYDNTVTDNAFEHAGTVPFGMQPLP